MHRNTIDGSAVLSGITIQAREVHGGVHVHTPPPPVPRQLLPVPAHFTNRRADLQALDGLLTDRQVPQVLVVISGQAGIGKTALGSRWLSSHLASFPDGQLYADLRGHSAGTPVAPGEALGGFLRAFGAASIPADPDEQASMWRSASAGLRIAVMLDNAFSAAQVRPLLPAGPGALVVVTSRHRLSGLGMDGARFHRLAALGPADGVELLTRGIGADRVAGEPAAVQRVVALCAGLPLAVALAAARLASRPRQPVAALAEALGQDAGRLAVLEIEGETSVRNAMDASYAVLSTSAARLYRSLGVLPLLTFDAATAAAACGEPAGRVEGALDELVEASLVEDIGPDTYRFHDLVRVHAGDRAAEQDPLDEREHTLRRVCEWYLRTATAAEQLLTPAQFTLGRTYRHPPGAPAPFTGERAALDWLDACRFRLMDLIRTAARHGWHETSWQLVDACWPLFLRLRHYDLWIEAHTLGLAAARADGDGEAERQMLNSGAIGLSAAGRTADAASWYEESLRAAREAGDVRDEGQALLGLGGCLRESGDFAAAERQLFQAVQVWEGCGYPRGAALARTVLGEIALAGRDTDRAAGYFSRARADLLAVGDPHDAARALAFLGRTRALAGDHAAGAAGMEEALAVFVSSGAAHWQARTLEMLADSAEERQDPAAARSLRLRALDLHRATSPHDAARVAEALGDADR